MATERLFVDTSAFYALMDRSDGHHKDAAAIWHWILEEDVRLATTNYVVVETLALLQGRLGFEAADIWHRDVLGLADVLWVDDAIHGLAYELWLAFGRRKMSFVDCVSFVTMRHHKLEKVFAFAKHFTNQGFTLVYQRRKDQRAP
jgi:predicted nucleic acid-binding protein